MRYAICVLLAAALVACKGDRYDDDEPIFCSSFGTNPTVTAWSCNSGCTAANPAATYDRDTATPTSLVPTTNATGASATFAIASATDFASGGTPGIFVKQPVGPNYTTTNVLTTYLNGAQQETSAGNPNAVAHSGTTWGGPTGYLGLKTTKVFDEVRFTTTNSWPSGQAPIYEFYEICSDGGPL